MTSTQKGTKAGDPALKAKVQELEKQVADYKRRLDELRKAKNTTVYKREREVLEVNAPQLGKRDSLGSHASTSETSKETDELKRKHKDELEALKKRHEVELSQARQASHKAPVPACNHEEEILRLKRTVDELEGDNAAILVENQDLKEQVNGLIRELSIKEAKWCETEEQLTHKLKLQWGEKYAAWMEETEKRLEELQQANALLRRMIKRPDGAGTSGKDND